MASPSEICSAEYPSVAGINSGVGNNIAEFPIITSQLNNTKTVQINHRAQNGESNRTDIFGLTGTYLPIKTTRIRASDAPRNFMTAALALCYCCAFDELNADQGSEQIQSVQVLFRNKTCMAAMSCKQAVSGNLVGRRILVDYAGQRYWLVSVVVQIDTTPPPLPFPLLS